jgi:hypothetical protein
MFRHQTAGQNHNSFIANKSFENASKFKYLGKITNQNRIHEEIKNRLNSGNAPYCSFQGLLPSRLLSKNLKIKKNVPLTLYVYDTWSVTLREEHRLRRSERF